MMFLLRKLNNFIQHRNKQGQPLAKIIPLLRKRYKKLRKKLSKAASFNEEEKILGEKIIFQLISLLSRLGDEFPFKTITSKKQRDAILELGQKNEPPPPMKMETLHKLREAYYDDLKMVKKVTGIDLK
jgi:hypothetical protein